MSTSTSFTRLLKDLSRAAAALGLHDAAWARRAGLPRETLSRLRRRTDCDFATLCSLARAVDRDVCLAPAQQPGLTDDGHLPASLGREDEERLFRLARSRSLRPQDWLREGPAYFMAGLAMLLASCREFERGRYLALAERLHPGISQTAALQHWLDRSPLKPSRFLPLLDVALTHAPVG